MKDFTAGSIPRHLITFLIPLLFNNMLQAIYMLIDALWAGRFLGPAGVAVVTTCTPVIFLLSSIMGGVYVGSAILAGQAFGAKNMERLSNIISSSFLATLGACVSLSAIGIVSAGSLLRIINTPEVLFADARSFLVILTAGMVFSILVQWFSALLNAVGDSRTPFLVLVTALVLNAALAPLLIRGWTFIPPLGIKGLAFSTVFAHLVGVGICFFVWLRHKLFKAAPLRLELHGDTVRRIFAMGFPLSVQLIVVSSSFLFILSIVNHFGTGAIAAFGIGNRIDQFTFLGSFAVSTAISAMTAQNIGAGRIERVHEVARWGTIVSLALAFVFFAGVLAFPSFFASFFTADPAVIDLAVRYFRIVSFSYLAFAVFFSYQGVLRGTGDTVTPLIVVILNMMVLRIPLCYYLSRTRLGEDGLWLGITISAFIGAAIFYAYYISGRWKKRLRAIPPEEFEQVPTPVYE